MRKLKTKVVLITKRKRNKKIKKTKKTKRNNIKKFLKGGNSEIKCVMCNKNTTLESSLVPMSCLKRYGKKAHRICKDCWWDEDYGFAREGISHGCPGCKKGLPLNTQLMTEPELVIID
jgi:hypothetical protein